MNKGTNIRDTSENALKRAITRNLAITLATLTTVFALRYTTSKLIIDAKIPSSSMETLIAPGDRIIGKKNAYNNTKPQRGDIIIFQCPDDEDSLYIKRIIGLPEEEIVIEKGKIYVNNHELEEKYIKEPMAIEKKQTFNIPKDAYLVLGDNRNNSQDARYWTNPYVFENKIVAKATHKWFPKIKKLK